MPVEEPWRGVSEYGWVPTLQTVLGGDPADSGPADIDPARVATARWVTLDAGFAGSWEPADARPWEHWRPNDGNHAGWNSLTIYRAVTGPSGHHFQLARARFTFYEPGGADFDLSPAGQARLLVAQGTAVIGAIRSNPVLDAATFTAAADTLDRVVTWLRDSGTPTVAALGNEIDRAGSDFAGTAAEVFLWALDDLRHGLTDLTTLVTEPTSWVTSLDSAAAAIDTFKTVLETAWTAFTQYRYHDPNRLVAEVIDAIGRQTDAALAGSGPDGPTGTAQSAWQFTFPGVDGLGVYDLGQQSGWDQLDADMKATWTARLADLEQAARAASRDLIGNLGALWASLGRGVPPLTRVPPGPGPTNGSQNIPDLSEFSAGPDGAGGGVATFGAGFGGGPGGGSGVSGTGATSGPASGGAPGAGDGGSRFDRAGRSGPSAGRSVATAGFDGPVLPGIGRAAATDDEQEWRRVIGAADPDDRDRSGSIVGPMGASPPGYTGPDDLEAALRREGLDVDAASVESGFHLGDAHAVGRVGGVSDVPAHAGGRDDTAGAAVGSGLHAGFEGGAEARADAGHPPMTPPLTGLPGDRDGRRRERVTWLSEDEKVWGSDPSCAPAVVGGEDAGRAAVGVPSQAPAPDDLAPDLPARPPAQAYR